MTLSGASRLIPVDGKLWLFGAWFGERYADNPRALYEYVSREHADINAVWLSQDRDIVSFLRSRGGSAYLATSVAGIWLSMRAGVGFVSSSLADLNPYVSPGRIINLWHGIPLKTIMYEDECFARSRRNVSPLVRWYLSKMGRDLATDVCVSSAIEGDVMRRSFRLLRDQVHVTGSPRLDVLYETSRKRVESDGPFKVLFAPTHRLEGRGNEPWLDPDELARLDRMLEGRGVVLYLRCHFATPIRPRPQYTNITACEYEHDSPDLYELLADIDLLITDYSSVCIDFLLTGRPIIFATFDLDRYRAVERGFNFEYTDVTPGPHCNTWDEVVNALEILRRDPDLYRPQRELVRSTFHPLEPGRACERVVAMVRCLLGDEGREAWRHQ